MGLSDSDSCVSAEILTAPVTARYTLVDETPMRLLRLNEVETGPNVRVFRYSRLHAFIFALAVIGGAAWLISYSYSTGWKLGYYIAAVSLFLLELMRRFISARFRPSNWHFYPASLLSESSPAGCRLHSRIS